MTDPEYLKLIKDRVDEIMVKTGFGELTFRLEVKDGKVLYVVFVKGEERMRINA